jgi:hypothetical protein
VAHTILKKAGKLRSAVSRCLKVKSAGFTGGFDLAGELMDAR